MIPPDDDHGDIELQADLAMRRLRLVQAITDLALARAQQVDDDQIRVYTNGLIDIDGPLVADACRELAKQKRRDGDTAFPSIGDIRDRCWKIRAEEKRLEDERAYEEAHRRKNDVMPAARRKELDAWMKQCMALISAGKPYPPMPGGTHDSLDVTYKCADCHDTKFVRVCECGKPSCADCHWQRFQPCHCRPKPIATEPEPKPSRARGKNWDRFGR